MREYTAATGPAAAADDGETARRATAFAELYRARNRQLVAYATSLTGDALAAEDLVAQAQFRVWRQLRAGDGIENLPAHLTTTLRNLAAGLERTQQDLDAATADAAAGRGPGAGAQDPEQHARQVALLARRIKQLPDRWIGALWHADAENLPMPAIGARIGADESAAALIVARARGQLNETFLRSQPGTAPSEACAAHWELMPSIVHGTAAARGAWQFGRHAKGCRDCGARLALLTEADSRFPLLLGPALLAAVLGGETRLSAAISGASVADAGVAGARAPRTGARHARVKPAAAARPGRQASRRSTVLISSVGIVGVAAAATALALGATGTHHAAAAAAITAPSDAPAQPAHGAAASTSVPAGATTFLATPTGLGSTPLATLLAHATQAAAQTTQAAAAASSSSASTGTGATGSQSATAPAGSTTSSSSPPSSPPSTGSSPTTTPSSPSGGASGSASATPPATTPSSPASPPSTTSTPSSSPSESDTSSGDPSPSASPSTAASSASTAASSTTAQTSAAATP